MCNGVWRLSLVRRSCTPFGLTYLKFVTLRVQESWMNKLDPRRFVQPTFLMTMNIYCAVKDIHLLNYICLCKINLHAYINQVSTSLYISPFHHHHHRIVYLQFDARSTLISQPKMMMIKIAVKVQQSRWCVYKGQSPIVVYHRYVQ